MVTKAELVESAKRDRAAFETEAAERHQRRADLAARGLPETLDDYVSTPMHIVHKTRRADVADEDAMLLARIEAMVDEKIALARAELLDVIGDEVGRLMADLDAELKILHSKLIDAMTVAKNAGSADSNRIVEQLDTISRTMT